MKKLFAILLILAVLVPCIALASTLREVQDVIYYTVPAKIQSVSYTLTGEIKEIYHIKNYHWGIIVAVDEEKAYTPLGSDYPYFIAEFSLIDEDMPYAVGDEITVQGTINPLYSSPMVPEINSEKINGEKVH